MNPDLTVAEALREAERRLAASTSPRLDAEVLLARSLEVSRARLYAAPETRLGPAARDRFSAFVAARSAGTPVPYLTGTAEFHGLEFVVTPDVLVPRPDTETLVETALERIGKQAAPRVLDLGTGSGAVAAAIASVRRKAAIVASDRSLPALAVARRNFERLGLEKVVTLAADWLAPFAPGAFDLIVANPPYVAESERATVDPATAFEPDDALFAGADGLGALRAIVPRGADCLVPGGWLALEHGAAQGAPVRALLQACGFVDVATRKDLAGHERVSLGRRP